MYSVVLMMAMTGGGDAVAHCGGKAYACSSTVVVSCGAKHSHGKLFGGCSCGFGHSLFGGHHHSCNSNVCSTPVTTTCSTSCGHSHSLFRGHSCNSSCGGHGFGLFRRHHNSCSAPVVVCSGS